MEFSHYLIVEDLENLLSQISDDAHASKPLHKHIEAIDTAIAALNILIGKLDAHIVNYDMLQTFKRMLLSIRSCVLLQQGVLN